MKALVIRTSGTNCDVEAVAACERVGFATELVHVKRLIERPAEVDRFQLAVVPGGFSYGDDLGAGFVHGNEIRLHLRDALVRLRDRGGLILGICNGFQVLVRAGLLGERVTLAPNASGRFVDCWVRLEAASDTPFLRGLDRIELPIAHGEGRFVGKAGHAALKYVDNPNGSEDDVAGICDPTGRIFGLMPHPERYVDITNHPEWTRGVDRAPDGLRIFENAAAALA